jgi:hypothetical protein
MILFCVTKCLGSFNVAAKRFAACFPKLQVNAIYWRQMLFIAGKLFFLQAHKKLQAGTARTLKIGNTSSGLILQFYSSRLHASHFGELPAKKAFD